MLRLIHAFQKNASARMLVGEIVHVRADALTQYVVPKHDDNSVAIHELLAQTKGFCNTTCARLIAELQSLQTEFGAIAQQRQELASVISARDDHQLIDARLYKRLDWVKDHRLVVHGQQVLIGNASQGTQARARTPSENDALHATPLRTGSRGMANQSGSSSRRVGLLRSRSDRIGARVGHGTARSASFHATARVSVPS